METPPETAAKTVSTVSTPNQSCPPQNKIPLDVSICNNTSNSLSGQFQLPEKENPECFQKVKKLLESTPYTLSIHQPVLTSQEAATVRGVQLGSGAKAMLIRNSKKNLFLIVMSASQKIDFKKLKSECGISRGKFASLEQVYSLTKCFPGAVPPFGSIHSIPIFCDVSLSQFEQINFNCGLRTHSITMKYADWLAIEKPKIVSISK